MQSIRLLLPCLLLGGVASAAEPTAKSLGSDSIITQEFIYDEAPFPKCHASTIVETADGLLCAWFGGSDEGKRDVSIWLSRFEKGEWTRPAMVVDGVQADGTRHPCWNPVLVASGRDVTLYFKVGPSPSKWWGERIQSSDGGRNWSQREKLPAEYLGPIKNKPLRLTDGTLVCGSSTEHDGWRLHFELYDKQGKPLARVEPQDNRAAPQAIQPGLLKLKDDTIVALCRPRLPGGLIETRSSDGGKTWSQGKRNTLPNPGSGIDALTLADGRHLVIYNHTIAGRSPLNIAMAADDKLAWQAAVELENMPGEYSYPAIIQTSDGLVHATYTWKRTNVRHAVIDPARLKPVDFVEGRWPK
jgi:predicted neuraminidase